MDYLKKSLLKLSQEELVEKAEALEEIKERDSREAAKYYVPNGKAEKFIEMVGSDKFFVNMFVGANGTSKTATGANIVANIINGKQSDWFDHNLFNEWPYIKRGRIISNPTTLKEKIIPELEKWLPRNQYERFPEAEYTTEKGGKYYASKFKFKNGWEFDLMSHEQSSDSFESVDLGFVWIDEPMPKDKFLATIARGRLGMIVFWTYTPLFQSAWIKDWMDKAIDNGDADFVEATAEDNCFDDNTELLTEFGWKAFKDVIIGDNVASYNLDSKHIEYVPVLSTIEKKYKGELIEVQKNLYATPDHRMITFNSDKGLNRTIKNTPVDVIKASELRRGIRMINYARNTYDDKRFDSPFPEKISGKDWCEFLGWYIAEGCIQGINGGKKKGKAIYITQKNPSKRKMLKKLLDRTGWHWKERGFEFYVSDSRLWSELLPRGNSKNKNLPSYIFEYPIEYLELLWNTLLITDGDSEKRYFTASEKLSNQVQRLLIKLGYRTSIKKWKQGWKDIYGKRYLCSDLFVVNKLKNRFLYINKTPNRKYYDGIVRCVSVKNETIIVRNKSEKTPLITGNCKIHGVRGFFEHKHIKRMSDAYPEEERDARVFGKFGHLIGRVHKEFSRKIHVIEPFTMKESEWTTYVALDPHPRVPDHVMYMSVNKKGVKVISAELLSQGLVKELHQRMLALEDKHNFRIEDRIIDPSAYNDDQHREKPSVGSQLFDLGQTWIKGSKDLHAGIKRTNQALHYELKNGVFIQEPEVYIFNTCPITIKQLEEYVWQEYQGKTADGKKKNPNPVDKNDHMPENLHRLLLHEPRHIPRMGRSGALQNGAGLTEIAEQGFDPY